jgi:molybdopterin synthase catalytic subunit
MYKIIDKEIDISDIIGAIKSPKAGAIVTFIGTTRDFSMGKKVVSLEYDAYIEMAERKLKEIGDDVKKKWDIEGIAIVHRRGKLDIGEASVCIGVSSAHRREAFEACHYAIDRLKEIAPIWKKETYEGGKKVWIEGGV